MTVRNFPRAAALATGLAVLLGACQNGTSPAAYTPATLQQVNKVDRAVVQRVRLVDVRGTTGAGTLVGAAAGGLGGSHIGSGGSSAVGAVAGMLVGGIIAATAERALTASQAYEYIVVKANGDLLTITEQDPQPFAVGQHVIVLYGVRARLQLDEGDEGAVVAPAVP